MKKVLIVLIFLLFGKLSIAQKKELTPVIIIMADQLRFDVLGAFTPNINSLKNDGVYYCPVI